MRGFFRIGHTSGVPVAIFGSIAIPVSVLATVGGFIYFGTLVACFLGDTFWGWSPDMIGLQIFGIFSLVVMGIPGLFFLGVWIHRTVGLLREVNGGKVRK